MTKFYCLSFSIRIFAVREFYCYYHYLLEVVFGV